MFLTTPPGRSVCPSLSLIIRDLRVVNAQQQLRVLPYPAEGYRSPETLLPRS